MTVREGERYLKTYWRIEKLTNLKGIEKSILQLLVSFAEAGKECIASEAYIAQLFGVSKSSVTRAKRTLQEKGLVMVQSRFENGEKKTRYILQVPELNKFLGEEFLVVEDKDGTSFRKKPQGQGSTGKYGKKRL